jgi:hypothetical protein
MQYCTAILKETIAGAQQTLTRIRNKMIESGNVFVLIRNEYDDNCDVKHDFFDVIDFGTKNGYSYVNTIVVPTKEKIKVELSDNVLYIVWFAKDRQKHFFNKDSMREPHIWKDEE